MGSCCPRGVAPQACLDPEGGHAFDGSGPPRPRTLLDLARDATPAHAQTAEDKAAVNLFGRAGLIFDR
jgi:hypothetical protein